MNKDVSRALDGIVERISQVIIDKKPQIEMILATWLMDGHVLLEDLPGTGKTVLAKCFSKVCQVDFGRVQFTPDLLPSDILGTTIYDQESKKFFFRKGPLFSDFFLADEINRATPRTQAALLEAMAERQITVENRTGKLSETFFVMATQNPLETHGTFPLPEAQLDRFTVKMSLGFLSPDKEAQMIKMQLESHPIDELKPLIKESDLIEIKKYVKKVALKDNVLDYIIQIAAKTRSHKDLKHGVSQRATLALTKLSQAYAMVQGRDYVIPGDIYHLAPVCFNHRLILTEDAMFEGQTTEQVVKDILKSIPAPTR
jgi:MoxR-like ATPase